MQILDLVLSLYLWGVAGSLLLEAFDWGADFAWMRHVEVCDHHPDFEPQWADGLWRAIGASVVVALLWPYGYVLHAAALWRTLREWRATRRDAELRRAMKHEELP